MNDKNNYDRGEFCISFISNNDRKQDAWMSDYEWLFNEDLMTSNYETVEDIIKDKYFLEVASAGIERPLVKLQDFERFLGREIKLKLKEPHNGKISFKGKLTEVKGKEITIKSKNVQLVFAYDTNDMANPLAPALPVLPIRCK